MAEHDIVGGGTRMRDMAARAGEYARAELIERDVQAPVTAVLMDLAGRPKVPNHGGWIAHALDVRPSARETLAHHLRRAGSSARAFAGAGRRSSRGSSS